MSGVIEKKMHWEYLPKWESGRYIGKVNWYKCIGHICRFEYDDIEGDIEIVSYDGKTLGIKYSNKDIFYIKCYHFKTCCIGKMLEKITNEFKIAVGTNFKDNKRDLTITYREHRKTNNRNQKWYKYTCNKCHWEDGWILEYSLITENIGCSCCANVTIIENINSMYHTDYWMVELGVNEEFAKTHSRSSGEIAPIKCPDCGRESFKKCNYIYDDKSNGCICKDHISYPEKFTTSVLSQLKLNFKWQLSKKDFTWCSKYRYDFLIDSYIILEVNGMQHYENGFENLNKRTLFDEQENDRLKKELALKNKVKEYIEIDCRYSELEFIKENILNSRLTEIYDLSNIDWNKAGEYAMSNLSKKACDLWNEHKGNLTTKDISLILGVSSQSIGNWLKRWSSLDKCDYCPMTEKTKGVSKSSKMRAKSVEIFKDHISLGVFESCIELERRSLDIFKVKLDSRNISSVATGVRPQYKGFTFKYVD